MKKLVAILLVMLSIVGLSSCLGGVEFELNFVVDSETYDTVSTNGKEIVKMPSDPTKDGYTFDGWYWDKDEWNKPFTANSLLDAPISSNMSVYAKWKANEQDHVHTPSDWIEDVAATCKAAGSKHKECTECEAVLETIEIEKLTTHTPADVVKEDFVDSTCEAAGSYNSVVYCSVCDAKISSEAKTVDKKEHIPSEWIIDTEATCKAAGSKHKECTECEEVLETEEIEKLTTHTPAEAVKENYVDSDCETEGSYNSVVYCSVCDAKISSEAKTVDKKEHTPSEWIIDTEATCKAAGSKHKECTECEEVLETVEIEKLTTHTPAEAVRENFVDSDCETEGSYNSVVYCSVCEAKLSSEAKTVEKKGHTPSDWIIERYPDESTEGVRIKRCETCGEKLDESVIPVTKVAALDYEINGDGKTCTIIGIGDFSGGELVIPEKISGYKVTAIGAYSLTDIRIVSVVIPDTVTLIDYCAFMNNKGLLRVQLGGGIVTIGESAFEGCSKLLEICNGSNLSITKKSSDHGQIAAKAKNVYKRGESQSKLSELDGFVFFEDKSVSYLVGYIGDSKALSLPEKYNGGGYMIYNYAFAGREDLVGTVVIPASVSSIGEGAFYDCVKISAIDVRNGVVSIGAYAFYNCLEMKGINLPDTVRSIGQYAFYNCEALNFSIYEGCNYVGSLANPYYALIGMSSHRLDSLTVHNDTVLIANSAFVYESLTSIDLSGVKYIGTSAFSNCTKLEAIVLGEAVESVGERAFEKCTSLKTLTILSGCAKNLGNKAFYGCKKLEEVTFGSTANIGAYAFKDCIALTSLEINGNVGTYAFSGCVGISRVTFGSSTHKIGEYSFNGCGALGVIVLSAEVEQIGAHAFSDSQVLWYVKFGNTSGWKFYETGEDSDGIEVITDMLSNAKNAGTFYKGKADYCWKRD